ncbi:pteridine reductase [Legionella dresdenensis]|uniref:Pteridine reductase n=1 Tax=Legionella dresdenensis TaxID=450200 RepID=A0ABV8CDG7_9GAMM
MSEKIALITGAARRIGATITEHLHQYGYAVIIHCHHSIADARSLAEQLNSRRPDSALIISQDLLQPQAAERLIEQAIAWKNRLDLLVNNASVFIRSPCGNLNMAQWQQQFTVNVQIPFQLSCLAAPYLEAQEGSIINITDIHAEKPLKGYAVYCQTKAALLMQTKALARELAPKVRVNAVAPGAIAWPEQENLLTDDVRQQIIAMTPLKRHGSPVYIAQAVVALAGNAFITGQAINVDGGRSIN